MHLGNYQLKISNVEWYDQIYKIIGMQFHLSASNFVILNEQIGQNAVANFKISTI